MTKKNPIKKEDCERVFCEFLVKKLNNPNNRVFYFVPRDVVCHESMFDKHHSKDFTQSEMKTMGNYLTGIQDELQCLCDTNFIISVHRMKDGCKKVYKLEVTDDLMGK